MVLLKHFLLQFQLLQLFRSSELLLEFELLRFVRHARDSLLTVHQEGTCVDFGFVPDLVLIFADFPELINFKRQGFQKVVKHGLQVEFLLVVFANVLQLDHVELV